METRLVKTELRKCYVGEGVNQLENCKELAERYFRMVRENRVSILAHQDRLYRFLPIVNLVPFSC